MQTEEIALIELTKHLVESEASFSEEPEIFYIGDIKGITLYKHENLLRQIFIIPPRTHIPPHSHPNVDSTITFVAGDMLFFKQGREIELTSPADDGKTFRIEAGVIHGAYSFDYCSAFINEQKILSGSKSAHLDWVGKPINFEHSKML